MAADNGRFFLRVQGLPVFHGNPTHPGRVSWVELLFWPLPRKPDLFGKQGKDLGGTGKERGHLTLATPLPPPVIKCMFLAGFVALQSIDVHIMKHPTQITALHM